ncbi:hypothetical protein HDV05_002776 [Chytridiales sp. JEL 0842]|nr:hypothetical protein HDV05_002776 [Chytridiales sp. JEL 0842]
MPSLNLEDPATLQHLHWLLQKDVLGQDVFLLGPPGSYRRRLAETYGYLTGRGVYTVSLHRDLSGSELKTRRELVRLPNKTGVEDVWVDTPVLKAVLEGGLLVLDGLERCERNVVSVLNNLLENREMNLEDGRQIIHPTRYASLLRTHSDSQLQNLNLLSASPHFRVIGLGLPVPPYPGNALDPPFRSRFQVRYISDPSVTTPGVGGKWGDVVRGVNLATEMERPSSLGGTESKYLLPRFPETAIQAIQTHLNVFPADAHRPLELLKRFWPGAISEGLSEGQMETLKGLLKELGIPDGKASEQYSAVEVRRLGPNHGLAAFNCGNGTTLEVPISLGPNALLPPHLSKSSYIPTPRLQQLLTHLLQSHSTNKDTLIVSPPGSGKTLAVELWSRWCGYNMEIVNVYKDMTPRDLMQRRGTKEDGSTCWIDSGLVKAAREGGVCVLEGVEWLVAGGVGVLGSLVDERKLTLPDGSVLMGEESFEALRSKSNKTDEELNASGIFKIHPSFRLILTATIPTNPNPSTTPWLTEELGSMFTLLHLPAATLTEEKQLIQYLTGLKETLLEPLMRFAEGYRNLSSETKNHHALSKTSVLSTRLLLRIAKSVKESGGGLQELREAVERSLLVGFMPRLVRSGVERVLEEAGLKAGEGERRAEKLSLTTTERYVSIGNVKVPIFRIPSTDTEAKALIPSSHTTTTSSQRTASGFFENPLHLRTLQSLLLDLHLGNHMLLMGNQGVGKNKITDRLLELLQRPREYIQLHRDSTVSSLTVVPSLEGGVVRFKDSPLVKAVRFGRVLVVDEADKAPVHVTAILKSLAESGRMMLSDGRTVRPWEQGETAGEDDGVVRVHPDFRMIVLANRPGYPFMGNDFFVNLSDVVSVHALENPDFDSELALVSQAAPSVDKTLLGKLIGVFQELRKGFDEGVLTYPYSLRELLHIARHLEKFGEDELGIVLRNVFDFDVKKPDVYRVLHEALKKHGLDVPYLGTPLPLIPDPNLAIRYDSHSVKPPPPTSNPKHGKEDPNNDPHIGGNTWAGGTGGSDTAGLGGRGGPYRLDKGHQIHQVTDAEKAAVPPHVLEAARKMGREALQKRLQEISMSATQGQTYADLSSRIRADSERLKAVLEGLEVKSKERVWVRHRTEGELDDSKLVDGLMGEQAIYMERRDPPKAAGSFGEVVKPKRIRFVMDVSGSMYRFNGFDGRLSRCLETTLMLMETLASPRLQGRFAYDIVGHSGDSACIPFVDVGKPPKDELERLKILEGMVAHSQYCWSGDNTVLALSEAMESLAKEKEDESDGKFVILLSDANLARYGIRPSSITGVLQKGEGKGVLGVVVFIGSLGREAEVLARELPVGKGFVCMQTSEVPRVIGGILASIQ